jgi:hypothetical protein
MGTGLGFDRKDTFADKTVLSLAVLLIANGTISDINVMRPMQTRKS